MSTGNYLSMCRRLWRRACEWDGIDPDAKFVSFSGNNHWAKKYNAVFEIRKFREAVRLRKE